jgi:hypothetical protein
LQTEKYKPIIDSIRDYILTCDFLKDYKVNVDHLGVNMEYSINALPCDPLIKKYVDGGSIKQFQFALTSKDCYDGDARTAIENSGFYEQFEDWIAEQDSKGIYPELIGKAPTSISVMQKGYLFDLDTDLGQYEIQCKLEYEQEV